MRPIADASPASMAAARRLAEAFRALEAASRDERSTEAAQELVDRRIVELREAAARTA